jgi:Lipopolysaccharide kinase (Kdo/WaaP) family
MNDFLNPMSVPPLPDDWPYEPRASLDLWISKENQEILNFGPGWTFHGSQGFSLTRQAEPLAGAFGRGGIKRAGDIVIRPYLRGGLIRFLNKRIYNDASRFMREARVHRALHEAGFPTVEPLGFAFRRRSFGVEGLYFTRFMDITAWPHTWTMASSLDQAPGESVRPALVKALRALCAWGLFAPDLNATNVMVTRDRRLVILDWDRAAFLEGDLVSRYRERLVRSLHKLRAPNSLVDAFISSF